MNEYKVMSAVLAVLEVQGQKKTKYEESKPMKN